MTTQSIRESMSAKRTGVTQSENSPTISNNTTASTPKVTSVTLPRSREAMIATAAYYLAEHRGFEIGGELDDWLAAEAEINSSF
jgi:Protein of unknown function (DUF2934)